MCGHSLRLSLRALKRWHGDFVALRYQTPPHQRLSTLDKTTGVV